ncbi:hypothetical protein PSCICO_01580 [Pseudomonas cichorii]|uniref:Uncharacterized protein n=1 Tax=Pseudomonas serbiensis TaxID=3064350 RepID=A0ABT9CN42_9PSED|nr:MULTISPECIES: hypothetical protein [Pseudomonas]MDO7926906.1 hypothetical protein [Pseudomonas sp. KFB-138]GFM84759.1 hypothetical protein PSCICO_01580 [Pseudomonas cichorii]
MKISINLRLSLGEDHYDVKLDLPGSTPTVDSPFLFGVEQFKFKAKDATKPDEKETVDESSIDKLLQVAIGDKNHLYVAVKPPTSLIEAAGVHNVVQNLEVLVSEGEYVPNERRFNTK